MEDETPKHPSVDKFERTQDFVERYANNVRFEQSAWDIKLIFGLLDQTVEPLVVRHHTSMNVTWAQAKLIAYFLQVNILFRELFNGRIEIQPSVIPGHIRASFAEIENQPGGKEVLDRIDKLRAELFPGIE